MHVHKVTNTIAKRLSTYQLYDTKYRNPLTHKSQRIERAHSHSSEEYLGAVLLPVDSGHLGTRSHWMANGSTMDQVLERGNAYTYRS